MEQSPQLTHDGHVACKKNEILLFKAAEIFHYSLLHLMLDMSSHPSYMNLHNVRLGSDVLWR